MRIPNRVTRTLGVFVFALGLLLGLAFSALVTWAALEANLFAATPGSGDEPLTTLKSPIIMTTRESGTIVATFSNPSEFTLLRTIRVHISSGFVTLVREESAQFTLGPGESRELQWTVTPQDAAWGRLILVRVHELRNHPLPARTGSCGILVVDLPYVTGDQVVILTIGSSLLLMLGGMGLWALGSRPLRGLRPVDYGLVGLAGIVFVGMLVSLTGWWQVSALLLVITVFLLVSLAAWAIAA